jgi:hypothetical protein
MSLNTLFSSIILQLCLASLGLAAPVSTEALDNSWQYGTGGGLLGLVVLILDVIVFGMLTPLPPPRSCSPLEQGMLIRLVASRGLEVEPLAGAEAYLVSGRLPLPRYRHDHLLPLLEPVLVPARLRLRGLGVVADASGLRGKLEDNNCINLTRYESIRAGTGQIRAFGIRCIGADGGDDRFLCVNLYYVTSTYNQVPIFFSFQQSDKPLVVYDVPFNYAVIIITPTTYKR